MASASIRGPGYFCAICVLGVVLGGSGAAQPAATPSLPRPSGPFGVGTTSFSVVDEARTESFADKPEKRQVQVVAWYPTADGATGAPAPYLRAGLAEGRAFAGLMRQPESAFDYLGAVKTFSVLDAPPRGGDRLPVLIFSHGYTAIASSYTALLEDLASHGYAVLSVVHPYEAMAATFGDGRVVTMLDDQKQMRKGIRDVLGEWGKEGETMASVTKATDEAERLRLMRVTSAQFCLEDTRCRAILNLDGIPQYGPMIDTTMNRPLLMVYSAREGRTGASDVIYSRAAKTYIRVDVADTLHNDFSDMVLWGGPVAGRPIFGRRPGSDSIAATRQIVREFFDQELRGRQSSLLAGRTTMPGVTVVAPAR